MIRSARIYALILLALSVLLALVFFLRTGISFPMRAGMLVYCVVLVVIVLGLFGRGGRELSRVALVLSGLWAVWGIVELGVWFFARPAGFGALTAFLAALLFSLVPGAMCVLALRQLQRGAVVVTDAPRAGHA